MVDKLHINTGDLSDSPGRLGKEDMHKVHSTPFSWVIVFSLIPLWLIVA